MNASERRVALLTPDYVSRHAKAVAYRMNLDPNDEDDLHSEAALFLLDRYNLDAFDETRYPEEQRLSKLRAHAGISLLRHLRNRQLREWKVRSSSCALPSDEIMEAEEEPKEAPVSHQARGKLERIFGSLLLHTSPNAGKMRAVIADVLEGMSLDSAISLHCGQGEWRKLKNWAAKALDGDDS